MAVSNEARAKRLALSQCMVEILRPCSEVDQDLPANERLVGYAIASGVYAGRPLGLNKITATVGLPRSTVRGVIASLVGRGWVVRRNDGAYDFSTEFHNEADVWFRLEAKYLAIIRAAEVIAAVGKHPSL